MPTQKNLPAKNDFGADLLALASGLGRIFFTCVWTSAPFLSAFAGELEIQATPAEVPVYEITATGQKNLLGKTPLKLKDINTEEPKVLLLESPGYASVYLPLSKLRSKASFKLNLRRLEEWSLLQAPKNENPIAKIEQKADQLVEKIITIQSLMDSRKTKEALVLADDLKSQYPGSFGVKMVYANALLLSGEKRKALAIYSSILEQLPANQRGMRESVRLIVNQLGQAVPDAGSIRSPARVKGGNP
ncbi:MAG: hypothetical protein KGP28_10040 [Bdellovibrionales bacterium]|nr:hypothetical protein [Bdellovibrionales bacterium]